MNSQIPERISFNTFAERNPQISQEKVLYEFTGYLSEISRTTATTLNIGVDCLRGMSGSEIERNLQEIGRHN